MIWGPDLPPYSGCGQGQLMDYLSTACTMPAPNLAAWVRVIRERGATAERERKQRDAWRTEARKAYLSFETPTAWPAAFLAVVQFHDLVTRAAAIYSAEEVAKILATRSRAAEKETAR